MSYTHPSAWQWYATADELINTRHFYEVNGVPVPVRPADGKQQGYYKTIDDKQNDRNYQMFYNQKYGRVNKYGKKEYWELKPEYVSLQQQISDRFDVITYKPNDRITQSKNKGENTAISTRPPRRTPIKEPTPIVIDTAQHEYEEQLREEFEEQLREEVGGFVEPVTTINTSGNAYAPSSSFFPVIPESDKLTWYWVKKPSGIIERINISEESKRKGESIGWIFNKNNIWKEPKFEPFTIIPPKAIIPPVTAEPDKTTSNNMINQEIISFSIINNRVKGTIKFIATDSFNPYYYNKTITNYLQLQSKQVTLLIKTNNLRFTETERDELINFDESAFDLDIIDAQSYVWTQANAAMSNKSTFTIQKDKPVSSSNMGFMGAGFAGGIAGLILLGFIADSRRKK